MSQQTTLSAVVPKFAEFIRQLPTVYDLATCEEETLHQLWSGLGYYARARNLKQGAQLIVEQLHSYFPQSYQEWLKIPGCGPYTAAAIASICHNEKVACIDGNVVRVVSRLLALSQDVWSQSGRSVIQAHLAHMIPGDRPGDFNQAMMELGATVCRKTKPLCTLCPLQQHCQALARNCIAECPPKKPRRDFVDVELAALLLWHKSTDTLALVEREVGFLCKTIGFPLIPEIDRPAVEKALSSLSKLQFELPNKFSHTITHHRISGKALVANLDVTADSLPWQELSFPQPFHWVKSSVIAAKLSTALDNKVFKLFQEYYITSE